MFKYFNKLIAERAERAAQKRNAKQAWFKKIDGLLCRI